MPTRKAICTFLLGRLKPELEGMNTREIYLPSMGCPSGAWLGTRAVSPAIHTETQAVFHILCKGRAV
jgi:hypothetical protein